MTRLLQAPDPTSAEQAWSEFLATFHRILMHVTRSLARDHDGAMDAYACVLERLRADDFRRLRLFVADGRSEFTTWLVVVAQRICLDHRRQRYGRFRVVQGDAAAHDAEWAARRRLVDLMSAEIDPATVPSPSRDSPDTELELAERYQALERAMALLDSRERLLVKLRFEDDLSVPEIARTLGLPTRYHAYRQLQHVLAKLRQALERGGVTDASQ